MKKLTYIFIAAACALHVASCTRLKEQQSDASVQNASALVPHDIQSSDTLLLITMPKNAVWGHLGEATGMSVLEFITDAGDTLYLRKESEITGHAGVIYGSIRNYTDRFCIATTDGGETLLKAVNVTQMQELWAERTITEE